MNLRATAPRLAATPDGARSALPAPALPARAGAIGDLLLLVFLLVTSVVPIVGFATGGRWDERMAGFATAMAILAGRELVRELRACRVR